VKYKKISSALIKNRGENVVGRRRIIEQAAAAKTR
jgi:hypothetical protein